MKRLKVVMLSVIAASGLMAALAATVQVTLAQGGPGDHKSLVCKYVSKPGEAERPQTGQNPIEVDWHALGWTFDFPPPLGTEFNDAQGRSVVVAEGTDCGGGTPTTGTTSTTPTTGTTSTTPTTGTTGTGEERGVATAGAVCVPSEGRYRVFGEIDGVPATVDPQFIAGTRTIPTIVTVTVGSDSQQILVNTAGTCVATTTTGTTTTAPPDSPPGTTTSTPPPDSPPTTTGSTPPTTTGGVLPTTTSSTTPETPVVTPPVTTTPAVTTPVRTPAGPATPTANKPKPKKPVVPAAGIPVPPQGCPDGSLPYNSRCYPAKFGGPVVPGQQG